MFSFSPIYSTPPVVKPATTAGAAATTPVASTTRRNDWVPPVVKTTPSRSSVTGDDLGSEKFEPEFQTLSARQRKCMEMQGQLGRPGQERILSDIQPRNLASLGRYETDDRLAAPAAASTPSNPRRMASPLIPASMPWSVELASNTPTTSNPPSCRRRAATDLMASTTPWTTQLSLGNPRSEQDGTLVVNVRRQVTDLIPQTMPWVTQLKTAGNIAGSEKPDEDINKFRRRKIIIQHDDVAQESSVKHLDSLSKSTNATFSFSKTISSYILSLNESQVRSFLNKNGLHTVSVQFDRDPLTGANKNKLNVVLRYREDRKHEVEEMLNSLITSTNTSDSRGA